MPSSPPSAGMIQRITSRYLRLRPRSCSTPCRDDWTVEPNMKRSGQSRKGRTAFGCVHADPPTRKRSSLAMLRSSAIPPAQNCRPSKATTSCWSAKPSSFIAAKADGWRFMSTCLWIFAHNAEILGGYPKLPAWLSRSDVYLTWAGPAVVGLGCFVAYLGAHTAAMNFTIWFEVVAVAGLPVTVVFAAVKRLHRHVSDAPRA